MQNDPGEELRENFNHFDSNNDGKIDQAEFIELMKALDAYDAEEDPALGFGAIDSDNSGLVEFDEFFRWFASR